MSHDPPSERHSPQAPPPASSPRLTREQFVVRDPSIVDYLAEHDAHCPECDYNLRGVRTGRCPECDEPIALPRVWWHEANRTGPTWQFGAVLIPLAAAMGVFGLLAPLRLSSTALPIDRTLRLALTGVCLTALVFDIGLAIVWFALRRQVSALPERTQWMIIGAAGIAALALPLRIAGVV